MKQGSLINSCSSIRSHYSSLLYQPLLYASLCFLLALIQLFLHLLSEGDEGTYLAWARQQCTAVQKQEWSGDAVGGNPIGLYHCQNSPSGPTILSYRALGNRQRSKEESDNERLCTPFFHRTEKLLPDCQELKSCVWQLQQRPWTGFTCLHEEVSVLQ